MEELQRPVACVGGQIADVRQDSSRAMTAVGRNVAFSRRSRAGQVLALVPMDGSRTRSVGIPPVAWEPAVVHDSTVWMRTLDADGVVGIDARSLAVRTVDLSIDCAEYLSATHGRADVTTSITLPVWVSTDEFECCHADAVVGEPWTANLHLEAGDPWWIEHATEPVPESVRTFGSVSLEGTVLRAAADSRHSALVAVGPVHVAVLGATTETRFSGFLVHEGHGPVEPGIGDYEVECTGVVRAVHGIKYRFDRRLLDGEDTWVPVAQDPPVECTSTEARHFDTYVLTIEFGAHAAATSYG
jgi:hypothetical protein